MPDVLSMYQQILIHFMYSHYRRDFHTSEVHWSLLLVADDMVRLYSTVQSTNSVQLHYSMPIFNEELCFFNPFCNDCCSI